MEQTCRTRADGSGDKGYRSKDQVVGGWIVMLRFVQFICRRTDFLV